MISDDLYFLTTTNYMGLSVWTKKKWTSKCIYGASVCLNFKDISIV